MPYWIFHFRTVLFTNTSLEYRSKSVRRFLVRISADSQLLISKNGGRYIGSTGVYKKESVRLVRQRYPNISHKSAEEMASKEFEAAAKKIFVSTIQLGRELRPHARWGFYGFPYCNYDAGNSSTNLLCNEDFRGYNDKMSFIFEASSALFPSIYLNSEGTTFRNYHYIEGCKENGCIFTQANPKESRRNFLLADDFPSKLFFLQEDICSSLKQTADLGARGVVLWSTSKNMKKRCDGIAEYVLKSLGP
uniref:Hyaluronidase n=1 Tax=Angiostrongylus cantonensis TaxID=6313 RepID=A0A158PA79_ANGCA